MLTTFWENILLAWTLTDFHSVSHLIKHGPKKKKRKKDGLIPENQERIIENRYKHKVTNIFQLLDMGFKTNINNVFKRISKYVCYVYK